MRSPLVLLLSLLVALPAYASAPAPTAPTRPTAAAPARPNGAPQQQRPAQRGPSPLLSEPIERGGDAKAFFAAYVDAARKFNLEMASLYTPTAQVCAFIQKVGQSSPQKICYDGTNWSKMLRQAMPIARDRGDTNDYSNVKIEPQPQNVVKITATRYNRAKNYSSPFQLYIQKGADNKWLVIRELSVVKEQR